MMLKIAIYGKGGIGKSTIASNLSAAFSYMGYKVLHIGCDPKQDSCVKLVNRYGMRSLIDMLDEKGNPAPGTDGPIVTGFNGVSCIECGGPKAGEGCAGRGISRAFEILEENDVIGNFDVVIFDVLGDVVCGGFAAPMRYGFGDKVLIVVSDEPMSLYAANNICNAIKRYKDNGIRLAGLIHNKMDPEQSGAGTVHHFAERIGADIITAIPDSRKLKRSDIDMMTEIQKDPDSTLSRQFIGLAERMLEQDDLNGKELQPMDNGSFNDLMRGLSR